MFRDCHGPGTKEEMILYLDLHAIGLLNRHYYSFADQDVLNITCKGRTRCLDNRWNSGIACGWSKNPVIDHFVSYADFWKNPNCRLWQAMKGWLAHYWATKEEKKPV